MPASVVVVHDDPEFLNRAITALRDAGLDVVGFADPIPALDAVEAARRLEVLVTRVAFPAGKPNGISLALVAQSKRPGLKAVFVARPEFAHHATGVGEFLPQPLPMPELVECVRTLLAD